MTMTVPFEKMLQFVEDFLWISQTFIKFVESKTFKKQQFTFNNEIRKALVNNDRLAAQDFLLKSLQREDLNNISVGSVLHIIEDIVDWYFESKRVFSLSKEFIELFLETNLPDFIPSEINFVANAFAIKLEEPIELGLTPRMYDFIVCKKHPENHTLSIRAYPAALKQYKQISKDERESLVRKIQRPGSVGFLTKLRQLSLEAEDQLEAVGFITNAPEECGYFKSIDQDCCLDNKSDYLKLLQIALGINLYLQTDRRQDIETRITVPKKRTDRGLNIDSEVDIFELRTSYSIQNQSNDNNHAEGGQVKPHFRRGFWRRPKGYGQNPEAKATEWVRPTWVRLDKVMIDGQIPIGVNQKINCPVRKDEVNNLSQC